jgi:hypothetical protein
MALVAYCNQAKWNSDLPSGYQYFDDVTIGGGLHQRNFCPVYSILYTFDATDDNVGGQQQLQQQKFILSYCLQQLVPHNRFLGGFFLFPPELIQIEQRPEP